jgi:ribosomal protein L17
VIRIERDSKVSRKPHRRVCVCVNASMRWLKPSTIVTTKHRARHVYGVADLVVGYEPVPLGVVAPSDLGVWRVIVGVVR